LAAWHCASTTPPAWQRSPSLHGSQRVTASCGETLKPAAQKHSSAELAPGVRNAVYLPVTVRLWVCLRQGVDPAYAERQLRQELIRALSPWCFDAAAEVRLGGAVRASDLVAAVEALPFVAYLERLRLFLVDTGGKPLRSSEVILEAPAADVVLIAAASQEIEFVSAGATLPSLIGIGNLRIGLDFQVA
jgi:hypothetical protein